MAIKYEIFAQFILIIYLKMLSVRIRENQLKFSCIFAEIKKYLNQRVMYYNRHGLFVFYHKAI